jgi:hypothetical protein
MKFEWYKDIEPETELEQGDILEQCHIILPKDTHYNAIIEQHKTEDPMDIITIIGIILSQTCDIINDKIDSIIVCPIWSLKKLIEINPYYRSRNAREDLRQGKTPSYHLLNKIELNDETEDFYFVDFHHIYSLPKNFVISHVKKLKRKRLLPPYREHLSQSFARYFMRVGLPTDISSDEIKNYKYQ